MPKNLNKLKLCTAVLNFSERYVTGAAKNVRCVEHKGHQKSPLTAVPAGGEQVCVISTEDGGERPK